MAIKGTAEGIVIDISDIDSDIAELKEKLENKKFFSGSVDFLLKKKDKEHYSKLREIIEQHGHILYLVKSEEEMKESMEENITTCENGEQTIVVKKTMRSGQKVEFDGNIVVIGDVNSGAEIFATGDVYIFGKARGVVHAGTNGDNTREIVSLGLEVTQMKIGSVFATSDGLKKSGKTAERAYIGADGHIEVK